MVTMNNILAFIKKAMSDNLDISTFKDEVMSNFRYIIEIKGKNKFCEIKLDTVFNNNTIVIYLRNLNTICIKNVSEQDLLLFKLLFLEVEEYSNNKSLEYFNNFFKKDDEKPIGVDDLDDDDLDDEK